LVRTLPKAPSFRKRTKHRVTLGLILKMKKTLVIIFTTLLLSSCKSECRKVISTHDNGNEKVVKYYPDCNDKKSYKREYYFENGQKSSEGYVVNDIENGNFKTWTKDGILTADWEMLDGKEHGFIQCWFENGVKKRESVLYKGEENGIYKDWDEEGNIIITGQYSNGEQDSTWYFYGKNGELTIKNYKNDLLTGGTYEKNIDSDGYISIVVGQYLNGQETGEWIWYNKDSLMTSKGIYKEGKRENEFTYYYKNGNINSIDIYETDSVILKKIGYDIEGNIILKNGTGKIHYYYDNGNFKYKGSYKNSIQSGISKWYYPNGQIEKSSMYENGYLTKTTDYLKNGVVNIINIYKSDSLFSRQQARDINGNITLRNGTGKIINYYDSGEIEYEGEYVNSKRTGIAKWYYKNGHLEKSTLYNNGLRMEVLESFDKNGKERDPGTLKDGNGTWIDYGENGEIENIDNYTNGKKTKPNKSYI
jgi:antitoxin component YwqK of YwqJK toxin-antitoxin module